MPVAMQANPGHQDQLGFVGDSARELDAGHGVEWPHGGKPLRMERLYFEVVRQLRA